MTVTRAERRAARRAERLAYRRAHADGPVDELRAAIDYVTSWAAEQLRRDRPDNVTAAAAAVARIPHQIEEGTHRGDRHPPARPGHAR